MNRLKWSVLAIIVAFGATHAWAANELMVHPTRVVFEGNSRTAQIDLINSGSESAIYRVSLIQRRMTETGDFVPVEEPLPEENFADGMIRFSPRQVVLQSGVAQTVRLQLRKPPDLEQGEYRSHLLFQALPPVEEDATLPDEETEEELNIRLTAIYSVSIPVIVRHGDLSASVSIREIGLRENTDGTPDVSFVLEREGTRSVYGDVTVYMKTGDGPERVVGRANGVAVYTPNSLRRARVPLPVLSNGVPSGRLRVTFEERPDQTDRVSAEGVVTVQ